MALVNLGSTAALLIKLVGWIGIALGLLPCVFVMPLTKFISGKYNITVRKQTMFHQKRQAVLTEALLAIRQIKISASEEAWKSKIHQLRYQELRQQIIGGAWMVVLVIVANIGPSILSGVPMYVSSLQGNKLSAAVAFTSTSLFTQLQSTLAMLPMQTPPIWEALDYLDRLEKFFAQDELDRGQITAASDVSLDDAVVTWQGGGTDQFTLRDLAINFPQGKLSLVTGNTGAGKSLLLAAISGEARLVSGKVCWPCIDGATEETIDGYISSNKMAIVSQAPWMDDATLQENILFGLSLDQDRYERVLYCCALDKDMLSFKDGDTTRVGIKGVALSGGQRWRVSLARALYSHAQFIILDDVLSAVDAEVREWIVEKALSGELAAGRTRVLVTHHASQCAKQAAYQVHLAEGKAAIVATGSTAVDKDEKHSAMVDAEGQPQNPEKKQSAPTKVREPKSIKPAEQDTASLVDDNSRTKQRVITSKYFRYFEACGGLKSLLIVLIASTVGAFIELRTSWQLKEWSSQTTDDSGQSDVSSGTTYILLSALHCLYIAGMNVVWYGIGFTASRKLFNGMTSSIFAAPLQWLEGTSHGEILTRAGSEMSNVDKSLPHAIGFMISCIFGVGCILITKYVATALFATILIC